MNTTALALTMGDPQGIAPEITLKAWARRDADAVPPFFFLGPAAILKRAADKLAIPCPTCSATPQDAAQCFAEALPVVSIGENFEADRAYARATIQSIGEAVKSCRTGQASAMVTNPITKKSLADDGFGFPGHTEFLAAQAAQQWLRPVTPVMMLAAGDRLRTVPVTIHIPLRLVPDVLSREMIFETGVIVASDLRERFGIRQPRLAVTGLNPHAGENGLMGKEDHTVIAPAIADLVRHGIDASGPYAADSLFQVRMRNTYDAVLAMYHDQALIPVKTLDLDGCVNVTLGLPFIRTSPAHGSARDLAGTGKASPVSLISALKLAAQLAAHGRARAEISPAAANTNSPSAS